MYFNVVKETDLRSNSYDGIVYICTPDVPTDSVCPCVKTLNAASKYDASVTRGCGVLPLGDVPAGRLVYASTGKIDPDYHDVRQFRDAAAKAIKKALDAGVKKPLVYLHDHPEFEDADLVTLLGIFEALHVVSTENFYSFTECKLCAVSIVAIVRII